MPPVDGPGFTAVEDYGQDSCSTLILVSYETHLRFHIVFLSLSNVVLALAILLVTLASTFAERESALLR